MKKKQIALSPGEMEILEILWTSGDLTLREVQEAFEVRGRKISYSTVQTRLERMVNKELLGKTKDYGGKYKPTIRRENVSGKVFDMVEELCRGNIAPLMVHLAGKRKLKPEEVATMRRLLDEIDE
ncbi:MAG: BlaI/MecI/CopY family transcriptional regulator [Thermoguttaceae bacterium]